MTTNYMIFAMVKGALDGSRCTLVDLMLTSILLLLRRRHYKVNRAIVEILELQFDGATTLGVAT
jgi:hypothetical protein